MGFPYTTVIAKIIDGLLSWVQGFNYNTYWKRREYVINPNRGAMLFRFLCIIWIKKVDARNQCSFGTSLNTGASFSAPPTHLPHGPNGIIVGHDAKIGKACTIFQQVTISHGSVEIGDNVLIGAGAKILKGVKIGNNVRIGANAVVVENIPDNCTVVLTKPRILKK